MPDSRLASPSIFWSITLLFNVSMLIYIVWQSSRVDTSQMTYKNRRSSALWKFSLFPILGVLLDAYLIATSVFVRLSALARSLSANHQNAEAFTRVTTKTATLLDN